MPYEASVGPLAGPASVVRSWLLRAAAVLVVVFLSWNAVETITQRRQVPVPQEIDFWQNDAVISRLDAIIVEVRADVSRDRLTAIVAELGRLHRAAPSERRVLIALMAVMRRLGETVSADRLEEVVARLGLRDGPFLYFHIARQFQDGRFDEALAEYDALIRIFEDARFVQFTDLANRAGNEDVRRALVRRLVSAPPWRRDFMIVLRSMRPDRDLYFRTFEDIQAAGGRPTPQEFGDYVTGLATSGDVKRAYAAWVDFKGAQGIPVGYGVFDGTFKFDPDGIPFGWNSQHIPNVVKSFGHHPDNSDGRTLTLTYFGDRTPASHIDQWLALAPGPHVLSGRSSAWDLQAPRGLVWRLFCRSQDGAWQPIAATLPERGSHDWRPFRTEFVVPKEQCDLQMLRLEPGSLAVLDTEIFGSVSFTDISIIRR